MLTNNRIKSASLSQVFRKKLAQLIAPGSFLRDLTVLGSGTALAQVIPILASPVLTRLYSPEDFAMFAVFTALVGAFTPLVCGKYEVALVTPKNKVHADHLLGISIYFAVGISLILTFLFLFCGKGILSLLNAQQLGKWIFSVPVALLLTGFFTSASYFANRNKNYRLMSKARVMRSLVSALVGVFAGIARTGFGGLLSGFFLGLFTATMLLFYQNRIFSEKRIFRWQRPKKLLFQKYRHYPLYNATSGLLNGITLSLPVFFMSRYFPEAIVGYYSLVMKVSSAPVGFISASVSQINLKKVVDIVNEGRSPIGYLLKLTVLLSGIIIVPTLIIVLWGPELFYTIFGPQWKTAGSYARILMPAIAVQFIASTLSSTFGATNNNKLGALAKIIIFVATLMVFSLMSPKRNITQLLYALAVINIICYFLVIMLIFYAIKKPQIHLK